MGCVRPQFDSGHPDRKRELEFFEDASEAVDRFGADAGSVDDAETLEVGIDEMEGDIEERT